MPREQRPALLVSLTLTVTSRAPSAALALPRATTRPPLVSVTLQAVRVPAVSRQRIGLPLGPSTDRLGTTSASAAGGGVVDGAAGGVGVAVGSASGRVVGPATVIATVAGAESRLPSFAR